MRIKLLISACVLATTALSAWQTESSSAHAGSETLLAQRNATTLYSKYCASCHGKDGRAKTFKAKFNHARNLTEAGWQDAVTDERIFNSIANGRGKMPKFSKKINENEINSLVQLVRSLRRE